MYLKRKKIINELKNELKDRIQVLSNWKFTRGAGRGGSDADVSAAAKFKGRTYKFRVEAISAGYPQYIREGIFRLKMFTAQDRSSYPVIAAPSISEHGKSICNENNVGYFDLRGNMKIACGGIYINTNGRERPNEDTPVNRSIFSPKASRITKVLLNRPGAYWTQKEILRQTGLSKGMISRIISRMLERGYVSVNDKMLKLVSFDDLFSAFVDSELRRRERKRNYYVWAQDPRKLMKTLADELSRKKIDHAFTQEAGASLVAPFASFELVTVYVGSLDGFPEKALSASRAERGFNLTVVEAPDRYLFTSARKKQGMNVVDNLQLYADLKRNPLRGEKQAELIRALIKKGNNAKKIVR